MLSCTTYIIRKRLQKYAFFLIQPKKIRETAPQRVVFTCGAVCNGGLTEIFLDDAHLFGG